MSGRQFDLQRRLGGSPSLESTYLGTQPGQGVPDVGLAKHCQQTAFAGNMLRP